MAKDGGGCGQEGPVGEIWQEGGGKEGRLAGWARRARPRGLDSPLALGAGHRLPSMRLARDGGGGGQEEQVGEIWRARPRGLDSPLTLGTEHRLPSMRLARDGDGDGQNVEWQAISRGGWPAARRLIAFVGAITAAPTCANHRHHHHHHHHHQHHAMFGQVSQTGKWLKMMTETKWFSRCC